MSSSPTEVLSPANGNESGGGSEVDFSEWTSKLEQFQKRVNKEYETNPYG